MTPRRCRDCGQMFNPEKDFHAVCWTCWHESAADNPDSTRFEIARLRDQLESLQRRLARPRPLPLDAAAIRWILQLVHPDKHNNSPRANAVTVALLHMREEKTQ